MAVIGSIRKRSGLLIILIGMAILLFVLGDLFGSGSFLSPKAPQVGMINGEAVDVNQLEKEAVATEQLYASYNQSIDRDQARRIAWSNLVREKVLMKSIEEAGISVTDDEFDDMRWGNSVLPDIASAKQYQDASGQFSPDSVKKYFARLYKGAPDRYRYQKKSMKENQMSTKYNNLIGKSVYYNSIDGKDEAKGTSEKVSFDYVAKSYVSIPDSTVTVSEDAMRAYFDEHKNDKNLEQQETRNIEYIVFKATATEDDIAEIRKNALELKERFIESTNDSTFVLSYSSDPVYNKTQYKSGTRADVIDRELTTGVVGSVVGPFRDGNAFKLAKIVGKTQPIQEARVRHILIKSDQDNELLKNRADSILRVIKRDNSQFDVLGAKFSEDRFESNQGIYDWFPKGQMVREFEDYSFNNPEGSMGVVKTQFGYHIIEVLGRRESIRPEIVECLVRIEPSTETLNDVWERAGSFAVDHGTAESFTTGAKEAGYKVETIPNLAMSAKSLGSVPNAREAVRWAFADERVAGEVSQAFDMDDTYVVAKFISKTESGTPTYESAKNLVKQKLINQLKADKIIASFSGAGSLDAVATSLGTPVKTANNISFNAANAPADLEPKAIGVAFVTPENTMSAPIRGDRGVYVVKVTSKTTGLGENADYTAQKSALMKKVETSIIGKIQSALNDAAGVENTIDKLY